MLFSEITGQEPAKERLRLLVDNHQMPHALLLEGPNGVGKLALARALAQYIHCQDPQKTLRGDSCGRCPACLQHQSFNHIDTIFSFPVIKAVRDSSLSDDYIDLWRDFLAKNPLADYARWQEQLGKPDAQLVHYVDEAQAIIRKLNFTAHSASAKIVIMWLPERMKVECANKLLKLIEEPLPGSQLIFVSDQPQNILPTIYSRLQRVSVPRLPDDDIIRYLNANSKLAPQDAQAVAHNAQGSLLAAISLVSANKNRDLYFKYFTSLMRFAYQRQVGQLKKWAVDVSDLKRERIMQFLEYAQRLLRENFILNLQLPDLNYLAHDEAAFSSKFSPFINHKNAEKLVEVFADAQRDISLNANAKIVLFDLAVRCILLLR